ncbi:Na+/H+ antiporter subunit A [uncultured Agrococcus sp.]|uniref:Na+/H+ antiporter subunit A n=1 Tax=uncultured Agrococcus sp. TaxID=382258 RepID=UPI0025F8D96D|nr:Na+/H+ antiporter subunit A [uncultured Agrococcus sp.]
MIVPLVISALLALITSPLSKRMGRWVFLIPAIASTAGFVWFASLAPRVWSGDALVETVTWIPSLGIDFGFRLGSLQLLLALVVTGVGAMILAYSVWYFETRTLKARTVGLLTGFAGSMLALVLADDIIVLVIAWELTTVFSYLLVGLNHSSRRNRSAAQTALIVTTAGGLSMLVGALILGSESGTYSLAGILANPPEGILAATAVMLLLVGALTKSANFPFHFWLPGAMAAPTPVSAFLHAAAMVKAGIYLAAALVPAFAGVPLFRPVLILLGVTTMIIGAWRALSQTDIKVLLAHGTVSQLGLLMTVVGIGTKASLLGGLALLAAHAMFKAALFMVVGIVDKQYGTRDLDKLGAVARERPMLAVAAVLAAAAMAGIPPTFAFTAKEVGLEAAWEAIGLAAIPDWLGLFAFAGIIIGSIGTVAYTLRFIVGTFISVGSSAEQARAEAPALRTGPRSHLVGLFPLSLALLGLAGGFLGDGITSALHGTFADAADGHETYLALWHGFTPALAGSVFAIFGGAIAWFVLGRRTNDPEEPRFSAGAVYAAFMRDLDRMAVEVTGRTQSGSLPIHISTIIVTLLVLMLGGLMFTSFAFPETVFADSIGQAVVGIAISVCAVIAANTRGRLKTFMLLGAVGYGTALMFLLHGAPDLALTQVLAETVMLVLLVLVLRHLPKYFTNRPLKGARWLRALIAVVGGLMAAIVTLLAIGARSERPISDRFYEMAYEFGYGQNIVNVTLVDIRAWDTVGEISVLLAAATGVASLIFLRTRVVDPTGTLKGRRGRPAPVESTSTSWLRAGGAIDMHARAPMLEMMTRLLFPVMLVVSVYLLFAGHNDPGGGFIAGMVAGIALCVRYLAAGALELADAAPIDAGKLLGGGIALAALTLIAPVFFGGSVGQSYDAYVTVWGMGEIHLVTSLLFDVGVYLVVVGTVLDFIRSLGSGIDAHWRNDQTPVPSAHSDRTLPMSANTRWQGGGR